MSLLSVRRPDCVPPLLGADLERGWMLMVDAGAQLRQLQEEERDLDRWLDVLPLYAGLQLDLAGDVDELLALDVPDQRLATLPEKFERFVEEIEVEERFRAAVPYVAELCEQLAEYGIPETIQHDDLHDGQIFVRDGRYLLMDWGDACVSHPFCTLSVTLEGAARVGARRRREFGRHRAVSGCVPGALGGAVRRRPRRGLRARSAARVGRTRRQRPRSGRGRFDRGTPPDVPRRPRRLVHPFAQARARRRLAARCCVLGRPDRTTFRTPCVLATNDDPSPGSRTNLRTGALTGAFVAQAHAVVAEAAELGQAEAA